MTKENNAIVISNGMRCRGIMIVKRFLPPVEMTKENNSTVSNGMRCEEKSYDEKGISFSVEIVKK